MKIPWRRNKEEKEKIYDEEKWDRQMSEFATELQDAESTIKADHEKIRIEEIEKKEKTKEQYNLTLKIQRLIRLRAVLMRQFSDIEAEVDKITTIVTKIKKEVINVKNSEKKIRRAKADWANPKKSYNEAVQQYQEVGQIQKDALDGIRFLAKIHELAREKSDEIVGNCKKEKKEALSYTTHEEKVRTAQTKSLENIKKDIRKVDAILRELQDFLVAKREVPKKK